MNYLFRLLRWTTWLHYWDELMILDYWDELLDLDYWDELLDSHYWDELLNLDYWDELLYLDYWDELLDSTLLRWTTWLLRELLIQIIEMNYFI